jgi:orotate phosphoribosyltransferase
VERAAYKIISPKNDRVYIYAMPGHYISASNHLNFYIGTSDIKHNHNVAVEAAMTLAKYYVERDIHIDTVLCLYETQALGAYIAHELSRPNIYNPNPNMSVCVIGPEYDTDGNLIFRDNLRRFVDGKRVMVLISCITSGKTVERAMESVSYYGGIVAGASSVFSAIDSVYNIEVNKLFGIEDVPGYEAHNPHDCPQCRAGEPVDAIANGHGYSLL